MTWLLLAQLWLNLAVPNSPSTILNGSWQSCLQDDGTYGERVWEYRVKGKYQFEFHMGPKDEFALFTSPHDDPNDDHNLPSNLLFPYDRIERGYRTGRNWRLPKIGIWVNVVEAGGSLETCFSYVVKIQKVGVK